MVTAPVCTKMEPCTLMEPTSNKTTNFEKKKLTINVHGSIFVQTGIQNSAIRGVTRQMESIQCSSGGQVVKAHNSRLLFYRGVLKSLLFIVITSRSQCTNWQQLAGGAKINKTPICSGVREAIASSSVTPCMKIFESPSASHHFPYQPLLLILNQIYNNT